MTDWELTPEERVWLTNFLRGGERLGRGIQSPNRIAFDYQKFLEEQVVLPHEREVEKVIEESNTWEEAQAAVIALGLSAAFLLAISAGVKETIRRTEIYQSTVFQRRMRRLLGERRFLSWQSHIRSMLRIKTLRRNNALIVRMLDRYKQKVVLGIEQEKLLGFTRDGIQRVVTSARPGVASNSAIIARDQISKITAALNQASFQDVGIDEYIWWTMQDERVRPTHRLNHGRRFSWDDPPPLTGPPGHDINCRCIAVPIVEPERDDLTTLLEGRERDDV